MPRHLCRPFAGTTCPRAGIATMAGPRAAIVADDPPGRGCQPRGALPVGVGAASFGAQEEPMAAKESTIPMGFRDPEHKLQRFRNWMLVGAPVLALLHDPLQLHGARRRRCRTSFGWTKGDLGLFELIAAARLRAVGRPQRDRSPTSSAAAKSFLIGAVGVVLAQRSSSAPST
ncbi:MAG: hypothetical protein MZV70_00300 [Desulfobacterales bacterium]|nr:hypothetical protein [Desulfobacterales bacterium]